MRIEANEGLKLCFSLSSPRERKKWSHAALMVQLETTSFRLARRRIVLLVLALDISFRLSPLAYQHREGCCYHKLQFCPRALNPTAALVRLRTLTQAAHNSAFTSSSF